MEATRRDPEQTRAVLLEAAFREVHEHGFQAASLERILSNTQLTKGALYHHFPNKQALGLALVDEVVGNSIRETYIRPFLDTDDPISLVVAGIEAKASEETERAMRCGCPLNNLSQEMSAVDEEFRSHLRAIFEEWREAMANAFRRGQAAGKVRPDVDAEEVATFIIAVREGAIGLGKAYRDPGPYLRTWAQLKTYLLALRP